MPSSAPVLPTAAPPEGAALPATASSSLVSTPGTTTPTALRTLRLGSTGTDVADLQRVLRSRGLRVSVDGSYGASTRTAVRSLQKRLRLRATGVVTPALLRRLGIQVRTVASGTGAAPATDPAAAVPAPSGAAVAPVTGRSGQYLKVFPVNGRNTYTDDYGAPRGQGAHEGNDLMAARGTPVVAVADGVIDRLTRVETGLGGIWIWMSDRAGNEYYYAHLDTISPGLQPGSRVAVGQQIGTVGNTGDARYGAPHLHFEIHPGGGGAINPYRELLAVDPDGPTR
jgi:murein DD-endopeptidase MepM/ murein hydrolase activator NlpD